MPAKAIRRPARSSSPGGTAGASILRIASTAFRTPPTISDWSGRRCSTRSTPCSCWAGTSTPRSTCCQAPTRRMLRRDSRNCSPFIARRRRHLRCYILIWDYAALYTLERDPFSRWKLGWRMPRRIKFGFDDHHPVGGSHHQKVIVVDDQLAFCGGIDLTSHRWDTCAHGSRSLRGSSAGKPYEPYHEVQAMVTGPAAASLGVLARDRWRALGEKRMPPAGAISERPLACGRRRPISLTSTSRSREPCRSRTAAGGPRMRSAVPRLDCGARSARSTSKASTSRTTSLAMRWPRG